MDKTKSLICKIEISSNLIREGEGKILTPILWIKYFFRDLFLSKGFVSLCWHASMIVVIIF